MARLIDSPLWVDFTRKKSPATLKTAILPWILDPSAALCEPVMFEVLRHAMPAERGPLMEQFDTLPLLPTPSSLWKDAAKLGQDCRKHGTTPGSPDLLIAALAIHHNAEIVTFDAGFVDIAKAAPLRVELLSRPVT